MKLAVISFTRAGADVCARLVREFVREGEECTGYIQKRFLDESCPQPGLCPAEGRLEDWTRVQFQKADGLIFVGATGIAVRAIAPCLKDKLEDPAVLSIDEKGQFVVSLLSGHVGGANKLAVRSARFLNAVPVISTATDLNGVFAVDVFAKENGLRMADRQLAREISACLLDGRPVGFFSDLPVSGNWPDGLTQREGCSHCIWVTQRNRIPEDALLRLFLTEETRVLKLTPRTVYLGIGCRKGAAAEEIRRTAESVLEETNTDRAGLAGIASLELKAQEPGILQLCREWDLPYLVFSPEELRRVPGVFSESDFVTRVTGVDNVCERAAAAAAGTGAGGLICRKKKGAGVTAALAAGPAEITFKRG